MANDYWLQTAAIIGWLGIAGPSDTPNPHNSSLIIKQSQTVSSITNVPPALVLPLHSKVKQPLSQSCKGTDEPQFSCDAISAQAAIDQARDAHRQILIGWLQAGGLVASLCFSALAARAAASALKEAEKGAQASRDAVVEAERSANAAHQANRPWLSFDVPNTTYIQLTTSAPPMIAFRTPLKVTNFGNSPAIRPRISHTILRIDELTNQVHENIIKNLKSGYILSSEPIYQNIPKVIFDKYLQEVKPPQKLTRENFKSTGHDYYLVIYVGYESIEGDFYTVGNTFSILTVDLGRSNELPITITQIFGGHNSVVT